MELSMSPNFKAFLAVLGIAALLGFASAHAATIQVACTPPTQHTDNSPITKPISYSFHWGTSATALTNTVNASACAATLTVPDPAPGTSITYHVAARATVDGVQSAQSTVVSVVKSTPKPTPEPPTGLRVIESTVFRLDQNWNNPKVTAVAGISIPLNTACSVSTKLSRATEPKELYMVDRKAVLPVSASRPNVVWAKCG
jgi:hypothetical protein